MKRSILLLTIMAGILLFGVHAHAEGDLTKQQPVEVRLELGNKQNALRFFPADLKFETGKLYKLVLYNPSGMKHYFSSESMAGAVFTRKVQVNGKDGKPIAEVKGVIREIEVYPDSTAEWWFVPVKSGTFSDLKCTIAGHTEAGMVGTIVIK